MVKHESIRKLILAAMFLALALVLPFMTMQIPQLGNALCPMHIPVLLCGFFCGPWYGLAVGLIAPVLRFFLFGMPQLVPNGIAMCAELGIYGLSVAVLYRILPAKKPYVYVALGGAMLMGRAVWGLVYWVMMELGKVNFGWEIFLAGAFTDSLPGIGVQIVLIPIIVMALEKYTGREWK